ncbi:MAG TPA: acetyl-CoA acetyltransferase [Acidimicrobiales bacterium]|nr:acetyl-CoA acetyltransferase [Acidimicrobiales bacterium]
MALDPRTPVVAGVGQLVRRPAAQPTPEWVSSLSEPVDMMAEALRAAAADSGAGSDLLARADSVRVVSLLSWPYRDPAALLADRIGAAPRQRLVSAVGGNSPQALVNDAASAIARGELDVAAVAGAEAVYTQVLRRRVGGQPSWTEQPEDTPPAPQFGTDRPGHSEAEAAAGLLVPVQFYPLFENALRARAARSIEDHQALVSRMWSRFSQVAASNPYAWSPTAYGPEELRTVSPDNRMIGFPYPKLMNANIQTDQAAGLIVCSLEAARSAGVPDDRLVFPRAGADAADHWFVTERADLASSPAIEACGRAVLEADGTGIDDVAHVDLYSCFPSAVQVSAAALGLPVDDPDRPLTVTGGLAFAGGPGNNYVSHSIAAMVGALRADPGSLGLVTAVGWYLTKHSVGLYSTEPPTGGFRWSSQQATVDARPGRKVVTGYEGPATVETYTVMHERDGSPSIGIAVCLTPDGDRVLANERDAATLAGWTSSEQCGRSVRVRDGGLEGA